MKNLRFIYFAILFLTVSCSEEEPRGNCFACCDNDDNYYDCYTNVTREECYEWDKEKKDGYDWTFVETSVACPPSLP